MKAFQKGQVSGKQLQTKKWTTEIILNSTEAVLHSCSTDHMFWEFQQNPPKKAQALRPSTLRPAT